MQLWNIVYSCTPVILCMLGGRYQLEGHFVDGQQGAPRNVMLQLPSLFTYYLAVVLLRFFCCAIQLRFICQCDSDVLLSAAAAVRAAGMQ
jgi:hypothetical protein